jgi:hypothetical protein
MSSAAEILANINTYVGVGASWIGIAVVGQDGVAAAATSIGEKVRPGWRRLRRFLVNIQRILVGRWRTHRV